MTKATAAEEVTKRRGGDADGPRSRPNDKTEDKQEKLLGDELDDSFPASDPPSIESACQHTADRVRAASAEAAQAGLTFGRLRPISEARCRRRA